MVPRTTGKVSPSAMGAPRTAAANTVRQVSVIGVSQKGSALGPLDLFPGAASGASGVVGAGRGSGRPASGVLTGYPPGRARPVGTDAGRPRPRRRLQGAVRGRVVDSVDERIAGHGNCAYTSPGQPRGDAPRVCAAAARGAVAIAGGSERWTRRVAIAGGRRTVTLERIAALADRRGSPRTATAWRRPAWPADRDDADRPAVRRPPLFTHISPGGDA
jgi:hypothetical protein